MRVFHVVDKEAENAGLRRAVEELRDYRQDEMLFFEQWTRFGLTVCSYLSFLIGVKIGHGHEGKGRDERGDNPGDNQIRNIKVGVAGVDLIGLGQNERAA